MTIRFAPAPTAVVQITGLDYTGVVDNLAAINAAMAGMPFGSVARIPSSLSGNKIGASADIVPPKGVILEADRRSTKLATDESVGPVIVPTSGYVSPVVATDVVGGTLAASTASNLQSLTRSSGTWDTTVFKPGQLVTLVGAAGGASLHANAQIFDITTNVMRITGGGAAGTCTGLTAKWGALVSLVNDFSGVRNLSVDAGTTVPRGLLCHAFRLILDNPDCHGGTLAALDAPQEGLATTYQLEVINPHTENNANRGTVYSRMYGPYSARLQQGDMQIGGFGRMIGGTKSFPRGASAPQVSGVHFTDATNSGPNLEVACAGGIFMGCSVDSVSGNGTALIQHLSATEDYGFNAPHAKFIGLQVFGDSVVAVPLLREDSTISSVELSKVVIMSTGNPVSVLADFPNGSNADTRIDDVEIGNGGITSTAALYSGGTPGLSTRIYSNNGTVTTRLANGDIGGSGLQAANNLNDVSDPVASRGSLAVPIQGAVQAVATSNVDITAPGTTFDGVVIGTVGLSILLAGQTTASQNGPWVWNGAATNLTRPADYASAASVRGRIVLVLNGTAFASTFWVMRTTSAVTVDTTACTWGQLDAAHVGALATTQLGLPLALTGATAATRFVGATASGAPASGTFAKGDFVIDQTGKLWVCTTAGSPGTWVPTSRNTMIKVITGTITPSASANTYGTGVDITPDAGFTGFTLAAMTWTPAAGVGGETLTFQVTATYDDATTQSTTFATVAGSITAAQSASDSIRLGLYKDGRYITKLTCQLQSTIASSTATATARLAGQNIA